MNRTRFAVAIAVVCVACVNVPDSIKGTFASHQGSETDNFSPSAPHSIAPPELTQATVPVADASTNANVDAGLFEMCPREIAPMSSSTNCLQDAGDQ
jgi:hypothetical protein